jgi:hypothetical protein
MWSYEKKTGLAHEATPRGNKVAQETSPVTEQVITSAAFMLQHVHTRSTDHTAFCNTTNMESTGEISGSHGGEKKYDSLVGCCAV